MSMLLPGAGALPPVASWDPEGDAPLEVPPAVRAAAAAGVQRVRDARPAEACRLDFLLEAVSADLPVEAPHAGHRPDWGVRAHALRPPRAPQGAPWRSTVPRNPQSRPPTILTRFAVL
jgi:hypothetical protein